MLGDLKILPAKNIYFFLIFTTPEVHMFQMNVGNVHFEI
jgi:hypothetical protein